MGAVIAGYAIGIGIGACGVGLVAYVDRLDERDERDERTGRREGSRPSALDAVRISD